MEQKEDVGQPEKQQQSGSGEGEHTAPEGQEGLQGRSGEDEPRKGDTKKLPQKPPPEAAPAPQPKKTANPWPVIGLVAAALSLVCWGLVALLFTRKGAATKVEEVVALGSLALGFVLTPLAVVFSMIGMRRKPQGRLGKVAIAGYWLSLLAAIPGLFMLFTVLLMLWVGLTT